MRSVKQLVGLALAGWAAGAAALAAAPFADGPVREHEWGFRPEEGQSLNVTPAPFAWRLQRGAAVYELEYARDDAFAVDLHRHKDIALPVYCPEQVMTPGTWYWRVRFRTGDGTPSGWSRTRRFTIVPGAVALPMPSRDELLSRVPRHHPRIMLRPEELDSLRALAKGRLKSQYDRLIGQCDTLMRRPPPTGEPLKYSPDMKKGDDRWFKLWWGNRRYTIRALDAAATLGFGALISGRRDYGLEAKRILLECAKWDPVGATGRAYNDEAGIPYLSRFSRAYSFVNHLLTEAEKEQCRKVAAIRGREMFAHLYPEHLCRPYQSHSNRAWHFLGEAGIVFLHEIPDASDWLWNAMNVFYCVYPVWGDDDGGWHEGVDYLQSYMIRFSWWAMAMKSAFGIDAFRKPFFSQVGYFQMYAQPPGSRDGGFGDQAEIHPPEYSALLMRNFAVQAGNPYWQWYADQFRLVEGNPDSGGYIDFLCGSLPVVKPVAPVDLPSSRCFRGTGLAILNSNLLRGGDNVQIFFKSSPFGTRSHGYDAGNSFLLNAYGERLLVRSGKRDFYGSPHHREWMWETKSENNITVGGLGQIPHSGRARGRIAGFRASAHFDYVCGEAAEAYGGRLERYRRQILFAKPEVILIVDTLGSPRPTTFTWHLHAMTPMQVVSPRDIRIFNRGSACAVSFLYPAGLVLRQTDKFDTPPLPRSKLVQHHLTAMTAGADTVCRFITVIRPHRTGESLPGSPEIRTEKDHFDVRVPMKDGLLQCRIDAAEGIVTAVLTDRSGAEIAVFRPH